MEPFSEFRYVLLGFILTSKYNEHWINLTRHFVLKLWIYKNHICELRGEELYKVDHRSYRRNFCICEKKACYYQLAPPSNSNWQNICVIFRGQEEIKKNVPDYVITHGILSKPDLEKLLQDTKVCISFLCIWSC